MIIHDRNSRRTESFGHLWLHGKFEIWGQPGLFETLSERKVDRKRGKKGRKRGRKKEEGRGEEEKGRYGGQGVEGKEKEGKREKRKRIRNHNITPTQK